MWRHCAKTEGLVTCGMCAKSWCRSLHGEEYDVACSTCRVSRCPACSSGACGPIRMCAVCASNKEFEWNENPGATCGGPGCGLSFKSCKRCGAYRCMQGACADEFGTCSFLGCEKYFCVDCVVSLFCAVCEREVCDEHGAWPLCEEHEQRCEGCGGPFPRCHACDAPMCGGCAVTPCTGCGAGCCSEQCAAAQPCAARGSQKKARVGEELGGAAGGGGGGGGRGGAPG